MCARSLALDTPPRIDVVPAALELRGVSRAFRTRDGQVAALGEVSLHVARGELACLVGPSGCGKTTLLRLAAGLLKADRGDVRLEGRPLGSKSNGRVGYVPQDLALLPWLTARDNVAVAAEVGTRASRSEARRRANELLSRVSLSEVAELYPHQLSGGMRQRVALARALAASPTLLLLDEPFAALDELTRERLRFELLGLLVGEGISALLVTHSVAEAVTLGHRVLVLSPRPGRLRGEVRIELPHPRHPGVELSPRFLQAAAAVRALLEAG